MKIPYLNLLTTSYKFSKDKKPLFVGGIAFFIVANVLTSIEPFLLGWMINAIQQGGPNMFEDFMFFLILYSLIPLVFWTFHRIGRYMERLVAFYVSSNLKQYLYNIVVRLPFSWHVDNHTGETINKFNKATNAISNFTEGNFMYIYTITNFIISIGGIVFVGSRISNSYAFTLFMLLFLSLIFISFLLFKFDKILVGQYKQIIEKENKVSALLFDYISNIRTVITLHIQQLSQNQLKTRIMHILPILKPNINWNEFKWFSLSMLTTILVFLVIFTYGYFEYNQSGTILIGNVVILFQYLRWFKSSFDNFAWQNENIVRDNTDLNAVKEIIDDFETIESSKSDGIHISNRNTITIDNLNFSYKTGEKNVLHNISLQIHKGDKIAFVGESGSGKSTMLSILKGLYETKDLTMRIDNETYNQSNLLADITALIPQDPEIFENTIRYNVSFGLEVDDEKIMEFIRLAKFDGVLARLPNGLDTDIKEKGVNLSGGEKQRLALARGLFVIQQRSLILLDEPTSSVDSQNELEIYKALFTKYSDKTIISSIHRLHLLSMFDKIYVFDKGQIVQFGTFKELISQDGLLKTSWENYLLTNNEN
ncbi:MAG: ABC transporter ATP-binding protein [Candidatus Absconditabacteria bacterium]